MPEIAESELALCLNVGSSSLKFALFRVGNSAEARLASGAIERLGTPGAKATWNVAGRLTERACPEANFAGALDAALGWLEEQGLPLATVVGHRVVHGGPANLQHVRVDAALLESLKKLVPLAPLHLPAAILGIEAVTKRLPRLPQVACFDTAFHAGMPEYAQRFAMPNRFFDEGLRRYGFHGLSFEYVLSTLPAPIPKRIIIAHLGSGASLSAIQDGRSIDTTMGLTPAGGIMMGTRTGDLDPGLLFYLLRDKGYSLAILENLVERESGLLGVAGSADMAALAERQDHDPSARLAIVMLGYSVRKAIGAYMAVLGGLDLLVFTGGIGENAASVREEACRGLGAFGVALDPAKNTEGQGAIHSAASVCRVLVVPTDEQRMIARHSRALARG